MTREQAEPHRYATVQDIAGMLADMEDRLDRRFASKSDLVDMEDRLTERFASKQDLVNMENRLTECFASKQDLVNMENRLVERLGQGQENRTWVVESPDSAR